ncbi:hypothetical protein E2C01_036907 [Portunus trituberculatus]|uniref:Uncharacterized protein n=1 Tax=Portunus trituberculatus TaxID=210409 RepID=A0A5B7FFM1_PORTR|nr:hypothetical protein [Portunus trituberculatus]
MVSVDRSDHTANCQASPASQYCVRTFWMEGGTVTAGPLCLQPTETSSASPKLWTYALLILSQLGQRHTASLSQNVLSLLNLFRKGMDGYRSIVLLCCV